MVVGDKFTFDIANEEVGAVHILVPIAILLMCLSWLSPNEKQLSVRTSSARRSKVSELGFLIGG